MSTIHFSSFCVALKLATCVTGQFTCCPGLLSVKFICCLSCRSLVTSASYFSCTSFESAFTSIFRFSVKYFGYVQRSFTAYSLGHFNEDVSPDMTIFSYVMMETTYSLQFSEDSDSATTMLSKCTTLIIVAPFPTGLIAFCSLTATVLFYYMCAKNSFSLMASAGSIPSSFLSSVEQINLILRNDLLVYWTLCSSTFGLLLCWVTCFICLML